MRVKRAQLQALRRDFEVLEMKIAELVTDYFCRVIVVANDIRNYGEDIQDVKIIEKILRTLADKFNYIVCSLEESKDIDLLSMDELQSSLIMHEQKFQRTNSEDQALKVTIDEGQGRGGCGKNIYRGRGHERGRGLVKKAIIECYRCHKLGQYKYECPT